MLALKAPKTIRMVSFKASSDWQEFVLRDLTANTLFSSQDVTCTAGPQGTQGAGGGLTGMSVVGFR